MYHATNTSDSDEAALLSSSKSEVRLSKRSLVVMGMGMIASAVVGGFIGFHHASASGSQHNDGSSAETQFGDLGSVMRYKKDGKDGKDTCSASTCSELGDDVFDLQQSVATVENVLEATLGLAIANNDLANANAVRLDRVENDLLKLANGTDIRATNFDYTYAKGNKTADLDTWDQCPFCTNWWETLWQVDRTITGTANIVVKGQNVQTGDTVAGPCLTSPVSPRGVVSVQQDLNVCTECYRLRLDPDGYGLRGYGGASYTTPLDFLIPYWKPNDPTNRDALGTKNGDCPNEYFGTGGYNLYDYNQYVAFVENGTPMTIGPKFACNQADPQGRPFFGIENWVICDKFVQPDKVRQTA